MSISCLYLLFARNESALHLVSFLLALFISYRFLFVFFFLSPCKFFVLFEHLRFFILLIVYVAIQSCILMSKFLSRLINFWVRFHSIVFLFPIHIYFDMDKLSYLYIVSIHVFICCVYTYLFCFYTHSLIWNMLFCCSPSFFVSIPRYVTCPVFLLPWSHETSLVKRLFLVLRVATWLCLFLY